jgi:hypothetical protein
MFKNISPDIFNYCIKPFLIPDKKRIDKAFNDYIFNKFCINYGIDTVSQRKYSGNYVRPFPCEDIIITLHGGSFGCNVVINYRSINMLDINIKSNEGKNKCNKMIILVNEYILHVASIRRIIYINAGGNTNGSNARDRLLNNSLTVYYDTITTDSFLIRQLILQHINSNINIPFVSYLKLMLNV